MPGRLHLETQSSGLAPKCRKLIQDSDTCRTNYKSRRKSTVKVIGVNIYLHRPLSALTVQRPDQRTHGVRRFTIASMFP
jgi:hypothetical protein